MTQNPFSTRIFLKDNHFYSFELSNYLNMPDLQFFQWCNRRYNINRGVYNTIDQWFYDHGTVPIQNRRIQILKFLDYVKEEVSALEHKKFITFGHGGLTKKLNDFIISN